MAIKKSSNDLHMALARPLLLAFLYVGGGGIDQTRPGEAAWVVKCEMFPAAENYQALTRGRREGVPLPPQRP